MLGLDSDTPHDPFPTGSVNRLDLLQDYRVIWRFGDAFLLLERLQQPRSVALADIQTGAGRIGEPIILSSPGGIRRLQADPQLSLAGRIAQAVALAPQVELVTQYADGERDSVGLTADELQAGVQLTPVMNELSAIELYSIASGNLNRPVERFWLRTSWPWAFRSQFDYTVESFTAGNAASADWPAVKLDDGRQLQLAAVQYDLEPETVVLDLFWEVDPNNFVPDVTSGQATFARLLDQQGNAVAAAEVELRDRAPGLRTLAQGPRRFLAALLRLPLPRSADGAVYDLQVGLAPAGQPPESAVWQTVLPGFVQMLPPE